MLAAALPSLIYPIVSAAALLGGAALAFIGSARKAQIDAAKTTIDLQGKEIDALKRADAEKDARISKLEGQNEVLTEKVTQAAAVDKLTIVLDRMIDKNASDHADLAALIGKMTR